MTVRTAKDEWRSIRELERDFRTTSLDRDLMTACRWLVADYILGHEELDLNGLTLRDAILISYPDVQ